MKNVFSSILVFSVIGAVWMLLPSNDENLLDNDNYQSQGVDIYMKNFSMSTMDSAGKPAIILKAATLEHDVSAELATLATPDIRIMQNGVDHWHITAGRGSIDDDKRFIQLRDDVDIKRIANANQAELSIQTQSAAIDIDAQVMTSDTTVSITSDKLSLSSTGMRIDNISRELNLLSSVQGQYVLD